MIETQRLIIKPYSIQHAEVFFQLLHDNKEHLKDYFFNMLKTNTTIEELKRYFQQKQNDWIENKGYACGIFLKENEQLIGHISIRDLDWRVPKGELAYFIFNQFVKQKYSSEALAAFRDWCINEKKVIRLFMKIAPDNLPSIKVAENCHFECEGLLKGDYRKQEKFLTDMRIYGFINPYVLKRTDAGDNDFFSLVEKLDNDLRDRYKEKQDFFDQFNSLKSIKNVVIAYENDIPVGCGSLKEYDDNTVELKRMYVLPEKRSKGIAKKIVAELEKWAKELQYNNCILETGILQPEAIKLYKNCGYIIIDNFGQYTNVKESICMKKELNDLSYRFPEVL